MDILYIVLAAFGGGIVLNIMPCVLPVLTMKVFHVLEKAGEDHSITKKHSIMYSLGIMIFFWVLCGIVVGFKVAGQSLLWGQQWQHPIFVMILIVIMLSFALNSLGVFELTIGMGDVDAGEGYKGSLINGIFAAIMATPCTAPGMSLALPFALDPETGWWGPVMIFSLLGFGLAFPFLLISYVPALGKRLPRPGPWMETFKMLMGFTLLAAAIWLFGVLAQQLALPAIPKVDELAEVREAVKDGIKNATWWGLGFLAVLSFVLWGQQHWGGLEHSNRRRWIVRGILVALLVGGGFTLLDLTAQKPSDESIAALKKQLEEGRSSEANWDDDPTKPGKAEGERVIKWVPYSKTRLDAELKRQRPVFLDFTAEWCLNCKRNEAQVLNTPEIGAVFAQTKIMAMKVDFTDEDEEIEKWIKDLGRGGVPIYVMYKPDGTRELLPELITAGQVKELVTKTAAAHPADKFLAPPKSVAPCAKPAGKQAESNGSGAKDGAKQAAKN